MFLRLKEFFGNISYCVNRDCHVYSKHYSAEPRVYQPDPPGLIHDDPRLLSPWRGSSLVWGKYSSPLGPLLRPPGRCGKRVIRVLGDPRADAFVHTCVSIHKSSFGTGVPRSRPRKVTR